jgi:hypothetical protein
MKGSFRHRLRAFQAMRGSPPDADFIADLEFLENRDLDVSVRLGAMLTFNALLVTIGTHPVSASPGAPLSLDAASHPVLTIISLIGIAPFVVAAFLCLRALLWGEEFDSRSPGDTPAHQERLLAAFVASIDAQARLLKAAVWATLIGGAMTMAVWAWILMVKMT